MSARLVKTYIDFYQFALIWCFLLAKNSLISSVHTDYDCFPSLKIWILFWSCKRTIHQILQNTKSWSNKQFHCCLIGSCFCHSFPEGSASIIHVLPFLLEQFSTAMKIYINKALVSPSVTVSVLPYLHIKVTEVQQTNTAIATTLLYTWS